MPGTLLSFRQHKCIECELACSISIVYMHMSEVRSLNSFWFWWTSFCVRQHLNKYIWIGERSSHAMISAVNLSGPSALCGMEVVDIGNMLFGEHESCWEYIWSSDGCYECVFEIIQWDAWPSSYENMNGLLYKRSRAQ